MAQENLDDVASQPTQIIQGFLQQLITMKLLYGRNNKDLPGHDVDPKRELQNNIQEMNEIENARANGGRILNEKGTVLEKYSSEQMKKLDAAYMRLAERNLELRRKIGYEIGLDFQNSLNAEIDRTGEIIRTGEATLGDGTKIQYSAKDIENKYKELNRLEKTRVEMLNPKVTLTIPEQKLFGIFGPTILKEKTIRLPKRKPATDLELGADGQTASPGQSVGEQPIGAAEPAKVDIKNRLKELDGSERTSEIKKQIKDLHESMTEKGILISDEYRKLQSINYAIEKKRGQGLRTDKDFQEVEKLEKRASDALSRIEKLQQEEAALNKRYENLKDVELPKLEKSIVDEKVKFWQDVSRAKGDVDFYNEKLAEIDKQLAKLGVDTTNLKTGGTLNKKELEELKKKISAVDSKTGEIRTKEEIQELQKQLSEHVEKRETLLEQKKETLDKVGVNEENLKVLAKELEKPEVQEMLASADAAKKAANEAAKEAEQLRQAAAAETQPSRAEGRVRRVQRQISQTIVRMRLLQRIIKQGTKINLDNVKLYGKLTSLKEKVEGYSKDISVIVDGRQGETLSKEELAKIKNIESDMNKTLREMQETLHKIETNADRLGKTRREADKRLVTNEEKMAAGFGDRRIETLVKNETEPVMKQSIRTKLNTISEFNKELEVKGFDITQVDQSSKEKFAKAFGYKETGEQLDRAIASTVYQNRSIMPVGQVDEKVVDDVVSRVGAGLDAQRKLTADAKNLVADAGKTANVAKTAVSKVATLGK